MDYPLASSGGGRASTAVSSEENDSESEDDNFEREASPSELYRVEEDDEELDGYSDRESRESDSNEAPARRDRKVKPRLTALPRVKTKQSSRHGAAAHDADADPDADEDSDDPVAFVHTLTTGQNEASSDSHASPDEDLAQPADSQANTRQEDAKKQASRSVQQDCEPSADPAEVECVVTDTSDDEDLTEIDSWNPDGQCAVRQQRAVTVKRERDDESLAVNDLGSRSQPQLAKVHCELCDSIFGSQECPKELLKHMQSVHKFAVRGLDQDAGTTESSERASSPVTSSSGPEAAAGAPLGPRKAYNCDKERGGCGAVFFSRQGLSSHHARSQSAGGTCWVR